MTCHMVKRQRYQDKKIVERNDRSDVDVIEDDVTAEGNLEGDENDRHDGHVIDDGVPSEGNKEAEKYDSVHNDVMKGNRVSNKDEMDIGATVATYPIPLCHDEINDNENDIATSMPSSIISILSMENSCLIIIVQNCCFHKSI